VILLANVALAQTRSRASLPRSWFTMSKQEVTTSSLGTLVGSCQSLARTSTGAEPDRDRELRVVRTRMLRPSTERLPLVMS
jgi:hypothetical protein